MYKLFAATITAALLAGAATLLPGMADRVEASVPLTGAKTDRLDLRTYGAACSQRGWPYYETSCLRDPASPTREARTVRIVSTDRLAAPIDMRWLSNRGR